MALGPDRRQAGHPDPLASERISALLEVEVSVARSAESANRSPKVDRPHGLEQSDVGRGTDRKRTSVEDWNSDFATHGPPRPEVPSQRWMTFVRNHAKAIIAADFFVVVTATFRFVYVLLVMEIETRRILHLNVTGHPTTEWTMQQFRECVIGDEGYRFIVRDRDSIYSSEVDSLLRASGLRVLKTPIALRKQMHFASG